ncbi:hypothetical protein F5Y16DRAFT_47134 [Xylariaceae sp. FL0255]|nr:hypothetical protein F5Y16DRAFT_47134 [Xylariaceae sp. FL0255]
MAPYSASSSARKDDRKWTLPSGFTNVQDLIDASVPLNKFASVMGLVKDFQAPIQTKGREWKCSVTIYDNSTQDGDAGLRINIFRPEDNMPRPSLGDVLLINSAKVQSFRNEISLISNLKSAIHVYKASEIPRPPQSAKNALQPPCGRNEQTKQPGDKEHEYAAWLYHQTSKSYLPDSDTFQQLVEASTHTKDKFRRLDKVIEGTFCDVIVNVVKEPYDEGEKTTMWVSDYSENDDFFKFAWDGPKQPGGRDNNMESSSKWTGPYGKRSIQVTCFEPHASFVNAEVHIDQWLRLRNLHIKLGNNRCNLEGVLHQDRQFGDRGQINILPTDDRENCDPRLKEAIRRKLEYSKLKKKQVASFAANENGGGAGAKRKAENDGEEPKKMNSKARRKEDREATYQRVEELDRRAEEKLGLSSIVKCESQEQPVTLVSTIIKHINYKTTVDGQQVLLTLPFTCAKYRANVRVVDFRPKKLESFATWRKTTETDALSDYSGSDSDYSASDDEGHGELSDQYKGRKIWEWRFALLLEEADPKARVENERFWVVVDNIEAQQLTGLDASDLRADPDALGQLREKLFKLWGNLEEKKLEEQQAHLKNRQRLAANQPPPSSPPTSVVSRNNSNSNKPGGCGGSGSKIDGISNKPFKCCIRQYGVHVPEPDPQRADAGDGRRWVRMFGLFGTKVSD